MDNLLRVEILSEPKIEFGDEFICDDPKMGISVGGFFSKTTNSHRSEIHFSIIGTNNNIEDLLDWLDKFSNKIEASGKITEIQDVTQIIDGEIEEDSEEFDDGSIFPELNKFSFHNDLEVVEIENTTQNKKFNPDFPGLNENSCFQCKFINDKSNNKKIKDRALTSIIEVKTKSAFQKIDQVIDLYKKAYEKMIDNQFSKIDVCFIVIPEEVYKKVGSVKFGKSFINLRRKLKANLIANPRAIPIQLILESSIKGTKKSMQDLSMTAWNFTIANYYKSGSIPWTLRIEDRDTCFIGVSFHKVINQDNNTLRSSIAQAFNYEGKGLVFVGKQFEWDIKITKTAAPHLSYDYAKDLIKNVIQTYQDYNDGRKPNRVVIHKTTDFWNSALHKDFCEVEGFHDGIKNQLGEDVEIDMVTIKDSKIKLFREIGQYPVPRGTLLKIDDSTGVLYATGYIPYYDLYPGVHMPKALSIDIYEGDSTLRKICTEILALTKMNFNNCNYYDSLPITIRFAKRVGEIVQYFPLDSIPPNKYFFYM
jgi:hypothetical protein